MIDTLSKRFFKLSRLLEIPHSFFTNKSRGTGLSRLGFCMLTGILAVSSHSVFANGDEFRTIDGSGNNQSKPSMGQTFTPLIRNVNNAYSDGINSMAGANMPSARVISNALATLPVPTPRQRGPSDYVWAWGQFLDHDISLSESAEPHEEADILVPRWDGSFDPTGTGTVVIPFLRTIYDHSTGTDANVFNPRQQINQLTSWIDASNVYGSDPMRADALRKHNGSGKLKTSPGRLLPFNTPGLPNAGGTGPNLFLAGDIRANEQVGLTALHTLFVREHNRLAKKIRARDRSLNGEQIYQRARRIVGAQMQHITYHEYLPMLLGKNHSVPEYSGYNESVDASIGNEFSTALYRYGHSAIGSQIKRLNKHGRESRHGHLALKDAFFAPQKLIDEGGIAPILRGLASQTCQTIDLSIDNVLRNFLFGPPGAGGFDLAALNIQRGRDHGLGDYNSVRSYYGLPQVSSFAEISSNEQIQQVLRDQYATVDDVDLWVGALAEDHYKGMVGRLIHASLVQQFEMLRDGDRFWYERTLAGWDKRQVVKLAKIIKRNTSIGSEMRTNIFMNK